MKLQLNLEFECIIIFQNIFFFSWGWSVEEMSSKFRSTSNAGGVEEMSSRFRSTSNGGGPQQGYEL